MRQKLTLMISTLVMFLAIVAGLILTPQDKIYASTQAYFKDAYNNVLVDDVYINDLVDAYKLKLPNGWYTDEIKLSSSDPKIAEGVVDAYDIGSDQSIYICGNYDYPYTTYKTVVVTAKHYNPYTYEEDGYATVRVHRSTNILTKKVSSLQVGEKFKVECKVVSDQPASTITYESEYPKVAKIDSKGNITAVSPGTTWITVRTVAGPVGFELQVKPAPTMNKKSASINVGSTLKLSVSNLKKGTKVTWSSKNPKITTVSKGTVKGIKPGKTDIYAKFKLGSTTKTVKCTVTVKKPELSVKKVSLAMGTSQKISVKGGSGKITWATSNAKVAKVSGGKITAVGTGKCTIKATRNGVTMTCQVAVKANAVKWSVVTRAGYYRSAYDTFQISKLIYNKDKSISVEGYFVNTHLYRITSFDYIYLRISDEYGNTIAEYKKPKFSKKCSSCSVNKITYTIPKKNVKKVVDFTKDTIYWESDYVYNYTYR